MMKSSSSSSVEKELNQPQLPGARAEKTKETSPPEPRPGTSKEDPLDPFLPRAVSREDFAKIPVTKAYSWSVTEFSAELQRELEAKGLRTPLIQSENSSQYLGSDEPPPGQFESRRFKCPNPMKVLKDCWYSYKRCSFTSAESMSMIIVYVFLMFFSIHAAYMGFNNFNKCPWSSDLPYSFAALGVTSLIALITRTYYLIQKRYFPRIIIYIDKFLFSGCVVLFVILYCLQCMEYYSKTIPPTVFGDKTCGRYFYNYARAANYCIPVVFIGMALLHGPTSFWVSTRHPCIENRQ